MGEPDTLNKSQRHGSKDMENIFSQVKIYGENSWKVKARRGLNSEELRVIKSAHVVDSQYGQSACFMMATGGMAFIPMSNSANVATGQELDLEKITLLTLEQKGSSDITRVDY